MHICLADDSILYIKFLFHTININVRDYIDSCTLLVVEQTNSKEEWGQTSIEMRNN